jgi:hypothetical protein
MRFRRARRLPWAPAFAPGWKGIASTGVIWYSSLSVDVPPLGGKTFPPGEYVAASRETIDSAAPP